MCFIRFISFAHYLFMYCCFFIFNLSSSLRHYLHTLQHFTEPNNIPYSSFFHSCFPSSHTPSLPLFLSSFLSFCASAWIISLLNCLQVHLCCFLMYSIWCQASHWILQFRYYIFSSRMVVSMSSVQFSSVTQSCPTLCDPINRSTPGLPVHHQLPEFN